MEFCTAVMYATAKRLAEMGLSEDDDTIKEARRTYLLHVREMDAPERDLFDQAIAQYVIEMTPC